MNMGIKKGVRKRKLPSFSTTTYGHPPKLKPIGYDSSTFSTPVIRNGSLERLNFSENFRDSYRELMPKLLEVNPNVGISRNQIRLGNAAM